MSRSSTRVYLDIMIGSQPCGRLVFKLFGDVTPKAAENFRGLATGEYGISKASGKPLCYRGCHFFRSIPGLLLQSGDIVSNDGTGGESIWGAPFADESFTRRHSQAGCLSMANNGRHTNASQFFITLKKAPQLDGRHVVIGQLIEGMEVLRAMQLVPINQKTQVPRADIIITGCGELASPAALRNVSMVGMKTQLEQLMQRHEKEVQKQAEDATKLKGSDDEFVSSSDSEEETPSKLDRKRRQERKQARFLESSMFAAQQAMDRVLSGVSLKGQLAASGTAAAGETPAAFYGGDSTSEDEREDGDTLQQPAAEAAAVDPLGRLLMQLEEEGEPGNEETDGTSSNSSSSSSSSSKAAARAAVLARRQKLLSLRLQINQGRALNSKEVLEEKRQWETPAAAAAKAAAEARQAYKRLQQAPMYRLYNEELPEAAEPAATAAGAGTGGAAAARTALVGSEAAGSSKAAGAAAAAMSSDEERTETGRRPKHKKGNVLDEALAVSEERQLKNKRKGKITFGWNVFNEDALYRAHKKRLAELPLRADEYRHQKEALGDAFFDPCAALSHPEHKPSIAALDRLVALVANTQKKRRQFSRRRAFDEEADVSYINERNRIYNEKLERSFDTREIKQNFERGTAL